MPAVTFTETSALKLQSSSPSLYRNGDRLLDLGLHLDVVTDSARSNLERDPLPDGLGIRAPCRITDARSPTETLVSKPAARTTPESVFDDFQEMGLLILYG